MIEFNRFFNFNNGSTTYGLTNELIAFYVKELFLKQNKNVIVLTPNLYDSNKIYNAIKTHIDEAELFPMDDFITSKVLAMSPEFELGRLNVLDRLKKERLIVVTNLMGYLKFLQNKNIKSEIEIKEASILNYHDLINCLDDFGYNRESLVTMTGEYAVRGFIIDIFPINETHPIRIEFFDNKIESIRYFDENTQRTTDKIEKIVLKSFKEFATKDKNSLYDYTDEGIVVYYNKEQIDVSYRNICEEIHEYNIKNNKNEKHMFELNEIHPKFELFINTISNPTDVSTKEIENFNEDFELLKNFVNKSILDNKKVYFYLTKESEINTVKKHIPNANIIKENMLKGFIIDNIICISENDIGKQPNTNIKYTNNLRVGKKIKSYNDLEKGDYIVHINHGIGIYNGLVTITKDGLKKDYIQLLYDGNDKIYIPVEKINSIYKYSSKDGTKPKINKLNSTSWIKTKEYIKKKAKDISGELLELYQNRIKVKGISYKDYEEEDLFGSEFIYEETPDQIKAIKEINEDLKSEVPMDRLLCGDVGFGKTEVAMRAIFKTVINNMQVMYLCPTTILSNQQYKVIKERFKDIPVYIRLLNRFTTEKEEKDTLKK